MTNKQVQNRQLVVITYEGIDVVRAAHHLGKIIYETELFHPYDSLVHLC